MQSFPFGLTGRIAAGTLATAGAAAALTVAASPASAQTNTTCSTGWSGYGSSNVQVVNCTALTGSGAPYVFDIAQWHVGKPSGGTGPGPGQPIIATCTGYYVYDSGYVGTGCTYQKNE